MFAIGETVWETVTVLKASQATGLVWRLFWYSGYFKNCCRVFPLPQSSTINNCFRPVQGEEYICVAIVGTNASSSDMLKNCHRCAMQFPVGVQHHPASSSQVLAMIVVTCYYVGDLVFPWMRQCGGWGASQNGIFLMPPTRHCTERIWDFVGCRMVHHGLR